MKAPAYNNTVLTINTILGYTFLSLSIMTPLIIPVFLVAVQAKLLNPSPTFRKIYGSLFVEFKHDKGILSSFYYVLFFWRRAIYVFNIVIIVDYVWY